jgi:hypothetical protein
MRSNLGAIDADHLPIFDAAWKSVPMLDDKYAFHPRVPPVCFIAPYSRR